MSTTAVLERQVTDLLSRHQYKYKDMSRREIMSALSNYKELSPFPDWYVYPNGISKELVSLRGTIPVNFRNSVYNIPVQFYLPDGYPYEPPIVYVRPTPDMNINVSSTVDSNGRVSLPVLSEWRHPQSDLFVLIRTLTDRFSEQTPLYTKPKSNSTMSNSSSYASPPHMVDSNNPPYPTMPQPPYPMSSTGMPMPASTASAYSNPMINSPYYPMNQPPPLSHLKSNSNSNIGQTRSYADDTIKPEHFRMSLITAAYDVIRQKQRDIFEQKRAEIDSLKKIGSDLQANANQLNGLLNDAENESENIRELTGELKRKTQLIGESVNRIKYRDKANIEDAVITTTPLYRQIFTLFSEELAVSDLIFYLTEGLTHKTITLDSFLRQVRALTRKQFILRVTIQKAREKAGLPV